MSLLSLWPYIYMSGTLKTSLTPTMSLSSGKHHKTQISKVWPVSLGSKLSTSFCINAHSKHTWTLSISLLPLLVLTHIWTRKSESRALKSHSKESSSPTMCLLALLAIHTYIYLGSKTNPMSFMSLPCINSTKSTIESLACQPLFEMYNISHYQWGKLTQKLYTHRPWLFLLSWLFIYFWEFESPNREHWDLIQMDNEFASCLSSLSPIYIFISGLQNLDRRLLCLSSSG